MAGRHPFDRLHFGLSAEGRAKPLHSRTEWSGICPWRTAPCAGDDAGPACGGPTCRPSFDRQAGAAHGHVSVHAAPLCGGDGGELEIIARFPDQPDVRLHGIGELNEMETPSARLPYKVTSAWHLIRWKGGSTSF